MKVASIILDTFKNDLYFKNNTQSITSTLKNLDTTILEHQINKDDNFISNLYNISKTFDYLIIAFCDSPFYCFNENKRLLDNALTYQCDYGFSDNHPKGVIFEILNTKALPIMDNLVKQYDIEITRDIFSKIIEKDINMFDLENIYTKHSLRTLRLSFFQDNQQDSEITESFLKLLKEKKLTYNHHFYYDDLSVLIIKNKKLLKVTPKYCEIEITHQKTHNSLFSPYKDSKMKDMSYSNFKIITDKIKSVSCDPVICINGIEEPSANKEVLPMIEYLIKNKIQCILETTTAAFSNEDVEKLILMDSNYLSIVLLIDATQESLYQKIRKTDVSFKIILENITNILLKRKKNTYIQTYKIDINFEHLNNFYEYFNKYTKNIIIQKYNDYRGTIEKRRINPMMPIKKIDCWHLKRDLFIQPNGDVLMCKQDITGTYTSGNILNSDIKDILEKSKENYEKYLNNLDFCKNCDENYTYNL